MPEFNRKYVPAEAERGKFAVISDSELTTLGIPPSASYGRYVMLTYNIGTAALSGQPVSTSAPNAIETFQMVTVANGVSATSFPRAPLMHYIEIQNNGGSSVWVLHDSTATTTVSSQGMEVLGGAFYSTSHAGDLAIFAVTAGMDVRVIGHYSS